MKPTISLFTGLILAAWAGAKVCDQSYHLQTATQVMLEGESPTSLKQKGEALKLSKSMGNATILHDSTEYKLLTDFDASGGAGACDAWVSRKVSYAIRKKAEKSFNASQLDYFLKINDTEFTFKKPGWDDYWFGIATEVHGDTVNLYDGIGKKKSGAEIFIWYGNAILKRTIKSSTGASKGTLTHFYSEVTSYPDSAALTTVLLDGWKTYVKNDTQDVVFSVQLIKLTYDSMETPVVRLHDRKSQTTSGFQASQVGQMVLIQSGIRSTDVAQPLSLYGMMGNKVATLHPTGYVYQWNGKTAFGTDAPTGVYFIQVGERTLGKFFYSR